MQLQFQRPYLSIVDFDPVEMPEFVVLTGENGSGKSHLLTAIESRHVIVAGMQNCRVVHFNYETFRLENEPQLNAFQISQERDQAWNFFEKTVKPQAQSWRNHAEQQHPDVRDTFEGGKRKFWAIAREKLGNYTTQFQQFFAQPKIKGNAHAQAIAAMAKSLPYSIDEIDKDEFSKRYRPFAFKNDFLPNQLGRIFWDYYIKLRKNQLNNFENEKNGKNYPALTEAEFIRVNGPKPWELVNQVLNTFQTLTYEVESPEGRDVFESYKLTLRHTEKPGLIVEFSNLSSGERILMALVASIYKSSSDNHFPDLLLLDEVDASLHPSMMRNMLQVVNDIFLAQGVSVILVTHSPTTIALAPEDSVYIMHRSGRKRIEKSDRQSALDILTQGFATLDQGLRLFDEVSSHRLTIITEGYNTGYIQRALEIYKIEGVHVLRGLERASGKNQLNTLFDFFAKVPHKNKVMVVWDCDVNLKQIEENNTFPYALPKNNENVLASKGIENLFPVALFDDFKKTTVLSDGTEIVQFDESAKSRLEEYILTRHNASDFSKFAHFAEEIRRILLIETQQT